MTTPRTPSVGEDEEPESTAIELARAFYGNWYIDGHRPVTDADMLRAVAAKLDEMDDLTDALAAKRGHDHRAGRTIQADLRRIADSSR